MRGLLLKNASATGYVGTDRSFARIRRNSQKTCFEIAEKLSFSCQYTPWFERHEWHLCNVSKKHYENFVMFNNINT
jgi:hypothetical protein